MKYHDFKINGNKRWIILKHYIYIGEWYWNIIAKYYCAFLWKYLNVVNDFVEGGYE